MTVRDLYKSGIGVGATSIARPESPTNGAEPCSVFRASESFAGASTGRGCSGSYRLRNFATAWPRVETWSLALMLRMWTRTVSVVMFKLAPASL